MAKLKEKKKDLRIRIKLESYDLDSLEKMSSAILQCCTKSGCELSGPIRLPVKKKIFTVNRCHFVNAKSKMKSAIILSNRLFYLNNPTPELIESLNSVHQLASVKVELKVV